VPRYLLGVLVAFLEPVFHGGCNIVDHFLSAKVFPRLTTLVFFGTCITVLLLPIVWYISPPSLPTAPILLITLCIAGIEVLYLYPYYYSLRIIDTSVVASLLSTGKMFVPILAYFVVGERLAPIQYAGFILISIASFALTFDRKKLRVNRALFLMGAVSLILAVETILYKYAFTNGTSWGSVVVPMTVFEFGITAGLLFVTGAFRTLWADLKLVRPSWRLFVVNEFFGWAGNMGDSFGLSILPATVSKTISSTQPIFALAYAYAFKKRHPDLFREQIGWRDGAKKLFWFLVTIAGVALVVAFGSARA
jgi:drug/metabolite transporter (DMT)-like permease